MLRVLQRLALVDQGSTKYQKCQIEQSNHMKTERRYYFLKAAR